MTLGAVRYSGGSNFSVGKLVSGVTSAVSQVPVANKQDISHEALREPTSLKHVFGYRCTISKSLMKDLSDWIRFQKIGSFQHVDILMSGMSCQRSVWLVLSYYIVESLLVKWFIIPKDGHGKLNMLKTTNQIIFVSDKQNEPSKLTSHISGFDLQIPRQGMGVRFPSVHGRHESSHPVVLRTNLMMILRTWCSNFCVSEVIMSFFRNIIYLKCVYI